MDQQKLVDEAFEYLAKGERKLAWGLIFLFVAQILLWCLVVFGG